ncbi:MAG: DinB family protein [Nocardioides sp.]
MSDPGADPRVDPPRHGDEVEVLRAFLTYHRDTLRMKCEGLTQEQLAQELPPSDLTLGGLLKHLAVVESYWFDVMFTGGDYPPPLDSVDLDEDTEWEWRTARDDSPAELRALFDEAVRRADAVVDDALARGGLEQESVRPGRRPATTFTLRWILVHMIEEYSRHNGHADLIRESIDGQKGE